MPKIYDEPSHVESGVDEVRVEFPDGVDISLTPDAAARTAGRLISGAAEATAKGKRSRTRRKDEVVH